MANKKTYTGINIQYPISQMILSGKKIIETRTYPLPEKLKKVELLIVETPGKLGKFKSRIVGKIIFAGSFQYNSKKDFYADYDKHLVDESSDWAWKEKPKWAWEILSVKPFKAPRPLKKRPGIVYTKDLTS